MLSVCGVASAANYTVTPKDGKEFDSRQSFANFNVSVTSDYNTITVKDDAKAVLMNEETGDEVNSTNFFYNSGFGMIIINFDEQQIKENGTWSFSVPAGSFSVDGEENTAISTTYTLNDASLGGTTTYEPITLVSVTPAANSELAYFGGEELPEIKFETSNDASVNYIEWTLNDVTNGTDEYIRSGNSNRYDLNRYGDDKDHWAEGLFVTAGGVADKLIKGHTYHLDLRFCGIGYDIATNQYPSPDQIEKSTMLQTTITYYGKVEPQEYSKSEYVSVSPDPEEYEIDNPDLAMFTVTYSAPAKPTKFEYSLGSGAGTAAAGTFAVADGYEADANGCATAWTFTFDRELVAQSTGTLSTTIVSIDKDGLYVKGNGGIVFNDIYYSMTWSCNCGATPLTVVTPVDKAEVKTLSSITISNAEDKPMGLAYGAGKGVTPEIRTMTGDVVRTLGEPTFSEDTKQATWTFDPITDSGTYVFIIPAKYIVVGEDMITSVNNLTEFTYYVLGEESGDVKYVLMPKTVTPSNNSNVEELSTVTLEFADVTTYRMDGSSPKAKLYKVTDKEEMLIEEKAAEDNPNSDFNNPTIFDFNFAKITADGTYKVVIEKGTFGTFAWDETNGESGVSNPQIVLNYTIGEVAAQEIALVSADPVDKSEVEELSTITVSNEKNATMALNTAATAKAEIRTMQGGVVCELDAPTFSTNKTQATWNFTAITEEGNYLLYVPAQYFNMGEGQDTNAETFFTYYVVSAGGVSYTITPKTVTPADGSTVSEIATITLEFAEVVYSPYDAPKAKLYKVTDKEEMLIEEMEADDSRNEDYFNPTIYDFNFTKKTDAGNYKVVIAQGTFGTGDWDETGGQAGKANPEIVLNYTIETVSVDAIIAAGEAVNVYTAQGIQVLRNAEAAALNELPAGFYIVNGKKVIIRK